MKKIKLFLILTLLIIFTSSTYANTPEKIAIGLKFASTSVSTASFKSSGLIVSNDISNILLSSDKVFTVKPLTIYISDENYMSVSQDGIKKDSSYFAYSSDLKIFKSASTKPVYNNKISNAIAVYDSKNNIIFATSDKSNLSFSSSDFSVIEIFGKKYRGALKFINNSYTLTVINYLDIEDYLLGVIANEMISSWNIEALKAQAVAARSFAYSNYNKFSKYGFNLTADTRSQAYGGYNTETKSTTKAVNETKGIVGYYNGKVAQLIYNASSGGKTEDAKNVWGSTIPYLIAQNDPYSTNDEYSNWKFTMTASEIEQILNNKGKNIGTLKSIKIDEVSASNYVTKITFIGTNSNVTYKGDSIRASLGYSKLKSAYFTINNNSSYNNDNDTIFNTLDSYISGYNSVISSNIYTFSGHGYGHGVGMSQYGAKTMADKGFDYKKILSFYYPGVTLGQI